MTAATTAHLIDAAPVLLTMLDRLTAELDAAETLPPAVALLTMEHARRAIAAAKGAAPLPECCRSAAGVSARVVVGAQAAYACISSSTPGAAFSLDVALPGAMSAASGLRQRAAEYRQRAARLAEMADRCDAGRLALERTQ